MKTHSIDEPVIVVAHHDGRMLELAAQVARELTTRGTASTGIDRHWLRGPHLRIWTTSHELDQAQEAGSAAAVAHRSNATIDEEAYLRLSHELGTVELVVGPYGPLREDNSVTRDDEAFAATARLIGRDTVALKRGVLSRFVPALALSRTLGEIPSALRLLGPMTMLAGRWQIGGVRSGYLTFRSHLEDHLNVHDPRGQLRERFEQAADRSEVARRYVAGLVDEITLDEEGLRRGDYHGEDSILCAWSRAFAEALDLATDAYDAGLITEDLGSGYINVAAADFTSQTARWTFDEHRSYSPFHHKLRTLNTLPKRVHTREFAAYRFVVNQFIRVAPLLDVSPTERYFSSLVFSKAVEEYFDTPWAALLDRARLEEPA